MVLKFEDFLNEGIGPWKNKQFKNNVDDLNYNAEGKVLRFGSNFQKMLFFNEIKGQISDGLWENTNPKNHHIPWITCKIEVGQPIGREFKVKKDDYALLNTKMLEVVGGRMWLACRYMEGNNLAKLDKNTYNLIEAIYIPWTNSTEKHSKFVVEEKLEKSFEDIISEALKVANRNLQSLDNYRKVFAEKTIEFINTNRDKLKKCHKSSFSYQDLLKELKAMKEAFKTSIAEGVKIDE